MISRYLENNSGFKILLTIDVLMSQNFTTVIALIQFNSLALNNTVIVGDLELFSL